MSSPVPPRASELIVIKHIFPRIARITTSDDITLA